MKYPYAIFDMDGTLLDSMPYWRNLGNDYLRKKGITPPKDLGRILASLTMEEGAEYFKREFGIQGTVSEIVSDIYQLLRREYEEEIQAKPGILAFLRHLKQTGVRMCVATATDSYMGEPALKRLGLYDYFEFILDSTQCGSGKTTPVIYDMAAAGMGGTRENTLVFEDAYHALCTAHKAGYYVVGVRDASQKEREEEIRLLCNCFIEDFQTAEFVWERQ